MPIITDVGYHNGIQIIILLGIVDGQIEEHQVHQVHPTDFQSSDELFAVITKCAHKHIKPDKTN